MPNNGDTQIIEFDVYGAWKHNPPEYRVYIDGELMTERSFLATETEFYKERCIVNIGLGVHTFKFERIRHTMADDKLSITNFTVNGTVTELVKNQFTISE